MKQKKNKLYTKLIIHSKNLGKAEAVKTGINILCTIIPIVILLLIGYRKGVLRILFEGWRTKCLLEFLSLGKWLRTTLLL